MMENAYDWEHLPHVHASSFCAIEHIASGRWGWRAKVRQTGGDSDYQVIELLVDRERHYWATTVISGPGQGVEIHTRATSLSEREIQIDVRFYSPVEVPEADVEVYLDVLTQQYALLYDEDLVLMSGRQSALDDRSRWQQADRQAAEVLVGDTASLSQRDVAVVETARGRYCVRQLNGRWLVHSAVCPHLLGPLDASTPGPDASLVCPWHGYRFSIESGENLDGKCRALDAPPSAETRDGKLYLVFAG
jgi:nitrite reductase/ring-hydroxylating ferredoxin subunit